MFWKNLLTFSCHVTALNSPTHPLSFRRLGGDGPAPLTAHLSWHFGLACLCNVSFEQKTLERLKKAAFGWWKLEHLGHGKMIKMRECIQTTWNKVSCKQDSGLVYTAAPSQKSVASSAWNPLQSATNWHETSNSPHPTASHISWRPLVGPQPPPQTWGKTRDSGFRIPAFSNWDERPVKIPCGHQRNAIFQAEQPLPLPPMIVEVKNGSPPIVVSSTIRSFSTSMMVEEGVHLIMFI